MIVHVLLTGAALLALLIGAVHSMLGERYIIGPILRRGNLPRLLGNDWFAGRTLRFAWHLTTVAWLGLGAVMLVYAMHEGAAARPLVLRSVSLTFIVSAVLAAGASRGRHLAWIVFAAIGTMAWLAAG